jgi:hypothetical protein
MEPSKLQGVSYAPSALTTLRIFRTASERHSIKSLFSSPNITPPQLLPTYSY